MSAIIVSAYQCCGVNYVVEIQKELGLLIPDKLIRSDYFRHKYELPTEEEVEQYRQRRKEKKQLSLMGDEYFVSKFRSTLQEKPDPTFPQNFIDFINENKDSSDVIFVDSGLYTRQILTDNNIEFVTVFPKKNALNSWIGRMYRDNTNDIKIDRMISEWDKVMDDVNKEPHGDFVVRLGSDDYMSNIIQDLFKWWNNPEHKMRYVLYNRIDK